MSLRGDVMRERLKRKLVADTIKGGYKYRDPSNLPIKPSGKDKLYATVVEGKGQSRPSPFATLAQRGR